MKRNLLSAWLLLVLPRFATNDGILPKQEDPTPVKVLEQMTKAYAECMTYRDCGVVTSVFVEANGLRTCKKPFYTAFVRPNRLRYEFRSRRGEEEFDRYIVWGDGPDVCSWWDVRPEVIKHPSIDAALAGATGVSNGSAHTIPSLLMRHELEGCNLAELDGLEMLETATLGGRACYRIAGLFGTERLTLWIDKERFLLRRIEQSRQFEDFRTETTTDYDAEINVPIPESLLTFNPPEVIVPLVQASVECSASQEQPTAPEILEQMAKIYANCRTYLDSGVVTTLFFEARGRRTERISFSTAFVRPGRFRYEFQCRKGEEEVDRYLIWRKGHEVRTWWSVRPGVVSVESVDSAIEAASGVSRESAQSVPGYLMPEEVEAWILPRLQGLQRVEDADIGETKCYRIRGTREASRYPEVRILWIDKRSLLLRRIEGWAQSNSFRTETTTNYDAEINHSIPESLLRFDLSEKETAQGTIPR